MIQAYNRRLLRRNVEQSRAIRFPDTDSESDLEKDTNVKTEAETQVDSLF